MLPNHQAREHMAGDVARYAFAAAFAEMTGRSPKAGDFPAALAPAHGNWASGKFAEGNRTQQFTQVGNAVPPLLARAIAGMVYSAIAR